MFRILPATLASAIALISVSCCCTGEPKAPGLRPLPNFRQIETTSEVEVHYTK